MTRAPAVSPALVARLLVAPDDDLAAAAACIAAGQARAVIAAMVAARRADGDDLDGAITAVMCALEALMARHAVIGGPLMAHFYPVAGARMHHHVCDAIDLWMVASRERALAAALRAMLIADGRAGLRASMRRRVEAWADAIERRAAE